MAKTCRTCEFCYPRYGCSEEQMPLDHITTDYGCTEHKPRETPLLVDELAKACQEARDWLNRFGEHAPIVFGGEPELDKILCDVLHRYQEEVGDA